MRERAKGGVGLIVFWCIALTFKAGQGPFSATDEHKKTRKNIIKYLQMQLQHQRRRINNVCMQIYMQDVRHIIL